MRPLLAALISVGFLSELRAQSAVSQPEREARDKAQQRVEKAETKAAIKSAAIDFRGEKAFKEKDLRTALKDQISTIEQYGLSPARGDDVAFFLELFYRKHGYAKADVRYSISGEQLILDIEEGPQYTLGQIEFAGNSHEPTDRLFDYAVGPTRERYSKLQKSLPFVASDIQEGAKLVERFYVAEGFLEAKVAPPEDHYREGATIVDVRIRITEGRQYFFGKVTFTGNTVYDPATLRGQIEDLLKQPYTDARVADVPRRLQGYFKQRGYYDVKVDATGDPTTASNGHVPVQVAISAGQVYHFSDSTVNGLQRLRPSYVTRRFRSLEGKTYSPDVVDEKFRTLMRTGLFNLLQIKPVPVDGDRLRLDIFAEEAKPKEFGFSVGYGSYVGPIFGVQFRDRNLFGYGRPLTTSVEVTGRGYKGEILWEDPFFFDSEFAFKARLAALQFDFDGYSKFELGGRLELSRKITKQYEAGLSLSVRHVEVTSADIREIFLGETSYFANTIGFTHTLDFRKSPLVSPRGLVVNNTVDVATEGLGSDVDFIRATGRVSYYIGFGEESQAPGVALAEDPNRSKWQRWYSQTLLAFGARMGIVHVLNGDGSPFELPIDERFFNGGSTTVRSFDERDLGPHDRRGNPLGGEFFTVFNAEYTFPIYGELQGAVFVDAGNLLPSSDDPSFDDMRYALGVGLRYKLPIGPIRLDYGFNPDPHSHESDGAFHFSFGFAF